MANKAEVKKCERYKVNVTPAIRKKIDEAVNAAAGKHAIVAALDSRHTGKVGTYAPYERYLLEGDFTVFCSLDTFKASMSSKPDRYAAGRVEKRLARQKKRNERKAAREAKAAEPMVVKVKATTKKAAKIVKYDPSLSTLAATERQVRKKAKPAAQITD